MSLGSERDERILALRLHGKTLQAIAVDVGITRERVRQILVKIGGPSTADVRAAAEERKRASAAEMERLVREDVQAHPASTIDQIAARLGVGRDVAQRHLPRDLKAMVVNPAGYSGRNWSEVDILSAIACAGTFAYPLSAGAYEELLRMGEIRGPSPARIIQLYGNWSTACHRAGVEPAPARRDYQTKWTDEDMLEFARSYLRSPGCPGTFGGYDPWRRHTGVEAPSSSLLRGRLGSWGEIKRKALAR